MMGKKAIVLGATGLIGNNLLNKLSVNNDYSEVLVISRRPFELNSEKLKVIVTDFEDLESYSSEINGDVVFCCLGSTAKKTPDLNLYRKIDYQYPLEVAKIALANGATQYHLVSAMGADVNSSVFYTRTKGEVERDLKMLAYDNISIYRPALLDGDRKEKRRIERIMMSLMRLLNTVLVGSLKKYRTIKIEKVADAMLCKASANEKGIHIYQSDEIAQIAETIA